MGGGGGLSAPGAAIGAAFGGPMGAVLGGGGGAAIMNGVNGQDNGPGYVTVDPRVAQLQQAQLKQANDFNSNINNFEKDQINAATDASRLKTLQDQNAGTASSNKRGLLYGGYNENQNNQIAAGNAESLNNRVANINANAIATGQDLNNQAIHSGLVLQDQNQNYNNAVYNSAMNRRQQQANGLNGLIGGAAGVVGALA